MTRLMNRCIGLCLIAALVACASVARAQQEPEKAVTLKVGDPAPPLATSKWVKGEPVTSFEPGKTYVVEMWATWCGPCRAAIPHVSEMQAKYKADNVIIIGQNVWENDQALVEPFVKEMGDKMDYRVAMDDLSGGGRGKMAETWMQAAGKNGIPCSFLIDKAGKIAWIGHPMALEPVLKKVIAGTFDSKKQAEQDAAMQTLGQQIGQAMQANDTDKVMSLLDEYQKMNPEMAPQLDMTRFQVLVHKKDYDAAYKFGAKIADAKDADPQALNALAWTIVDDKGIEKRDLPLAEKMAARAVEMTKSKDAAILDTYARVMFDQGKIDRAIELQTQAVAAADNTLRGDLQATLDKYKDAKKNGGAVN